MTRTFALLAAGAGCILLAAAVAGPAMAAPAAVPAANADREAGPSRRVHRAAWRIGWPGAVHQ